MTRAPLDVTGPYLSGFRRVLRRVELLPGFFLLPVDIPGPDVGRALAAFLTAQGHPTQVVEPRADEEVWRYLPATLGGVERLPGGVVMLLGADPGDLPASVRAGLNLLNQRRDTIAKRLECPLLWCGPVSFLNLSSGEAPDFWSIRSIDLRIEPESVEQEAPPEAPSAPPATWGLRDLWQAARAQGDLAGAARFAAKLVDQLLEEQDLEEAARVLAEAMTPQSGAPASEDLALRGALLDQRRGRLFAAAATLEKLRAKPVTAPSLRLQASLALGGVLEQGGDLERAEAVFREALGMAEAREDFEAEVRASIGVYRLAAQAGRAKEAEAELAKAREGAARLGDPALAALVTEAEGLAAFAALDTRKGEALRAEALRASPLVAQVERVALLREPGAQVMRRHAPPPFAGLLEVAVTLGPIVDLRVLGVLEQPLTEALLERYVEIERRYRRENPALSSTLIHLGPAAPVQLARAALRRGVALKTFAEYQGLLDFTRYLERQTAALERDAVYPPSLYVKQPARYSLAGGREELRTDSALQMLWDMLDADYARFALVLGDFGAGKTFLLHELARRMATDKHPVIPVLVEMSRLEKQRDLKVLLAQHFATAEMGRFDPDAFLYMLGEGRVALLFDGFDELALRGTYDRAMEHLQTVMAAVRGSAKVVVTSRTQHFLTTQQVRRALAQLAETVPGYRLVQLERFGEAQIRHFLENIIPDEREALARFELLGEVKDLLGLSQNPRMLSFIAKIEPAKLREAQERSGEITAAKLYRILIDQWLDFEFHRANPPGAPRGLTPDDLRALVCKVAMALWEAGSRALPLADLAGVLASEGHDSAVVEHMVGSGSLLVRDGAGRFSFVHRSVMEWLIADAAARDLCEYKDPPMLAKGEMSDLMADFVLSLATAERAEAWAWEKVGRAGDGHAKNNARRVLERFELTRPRKAGEQDVPAVVDHSGQDLRGRDFTGAAWRHANLREADLRGTTLVRAELTGASLAGARLDRADLTAVDLKGAELRGAELRFARLTGADMRSTQGLTATQLWGAKLVGAQGIDIAGLAEVGAAPPVVSSALPMWAPASPCVAVAWSPLGDLLAAGYENGTIVLWDAFAGTALRTLHAHRDLVNSVCFSPDGRSLASASGDTTVRLWDVPTGTGSQLLSNHAAEVTSVAWSPDGKLLASGSQDETVVLWDVSAGHSVRTWEGHESGVLAVAWSPDGKTLASGSYGGVIVLWDVETGARAGVLEGHSRGVSSVAWSPDGRALASGSYDESVRLWDRTGGRCILVFQGHTKGVSSVAWSPDGKTVVSGSEDATVRLWDIATGESTCVLKKHKDTVWSVAVSPDSKRLASASKDKTLRLRELPGGASLHLLEGNGVSLTSFAMSLDGRTFAWGTEGTREVHLWDLQAVRARSTLQEPEDAVRTGHTGAVRSIAISADSKLLVAGADDNTVRLWKLDRPDAPQVLRHHEGTVWSVAVSPDGRLLASGSEDMRVVLFELATGTTLHTFEGHTDGVLSVTFDPTGKLLASGASDETVRLWDIETRACIHVCEGHAGGVPAVAFSHDGKVVASSAEDTTVRLWDVATCACLQTLQGHTDTVTSVAFSPDGKLLASGSEDSTIRLWRSDGTPLRVFEGHAGHIKGVAVSPDGGVVTSASADGTVRLWAIATGRCLAVLLPCAKGWAAFRPDGRYKLGGNVGGAFWHLIGLCRFEPGELDPYLPGLRIAGDEPLVLPNN